MNFNQRDLVLVRYPFSNMADYKIRSAIIVSNNNFNKFNYLWVCPVTTKKHSSSVSINESLIEGKLDNISYAKTDTIAVYEKEIILKKLGKIENSFTNKIIDLLIKNF